MSLENRVRPAGTPIYPFAIYVKTTPLEKIYGAILGVTVYPDRSVSGLFYSGGGHRGMLVSKSGRHGGNISDFELVWSPFTWNEDTADFELKPEFAMLAEVIGVIGTIRAPSKPEMTSTAAPPSKPKPRRELPEKIKTARATNEPKSVAELKAEQRERMARARAVKTKRAEEQLSASAK